MRIQAPGEYVHVYNRGMQKQPIFEIESDYLRFLFLVLTLQGEYVLKNISREVELVKEIRSDRLVEVVNFCLMPNHFHLLLKEEKENGIARYIQRLSIAYTKYFNKRHDKSGHLFQGAYKSVHIGSDEQLMHLSAYIHKNPCEIKGYRGKEETFLWSSYQDCLGNNRFSNLLVTDIITERFYKNKGMGTYRKFVTTSPAKEFDQEF